MIRPATPRPGLYAYDNAVRRAGFEHVAGLDEAGRGACAGPLVAAAVVLRPGTRIRELDDSKALSATTRERVATRIRRLALAWSVGEVTVEEIDGMGLHRANLLAFRRAWTRLSMLPDFALCDGFAPHGLGRPELAVWKGDNVSASIAAASVVAKVTRDQVLSRLDARHPQYGFVVHKGYATPAHQQALARHGPSPVHRHSFITVQRLTREGAA